MMRRRSVLLATVFIAPLVLGSIRPGWAGETARGVGATFPLPLYERWAKAFVAQSDDTITYTGTGSGDGLKQALAGTVDFGGSDMPATDTDARALIQVPSVVGGIVIVVNLPGIDPGGIVIDGPMLAGLFSGAIRPWNDPAIARLNPIAPLPAIAVRPVHRSDASGTTFVVTDYLTKIDATWAQGPGRGTSVRWPKGVEAKGSDGMVQAVAAEPGSIGYVEYSYARKGVMTYVNLMSADGRSVQPTPMSFAAAVAGLDWPTFLKPDSDKSLTNRPGGGAWPLTSATFVLFRTGGATAAPGRALAARMFQWGLERGGSIAEDLDYVPLPASGAKAAGEALSGVTGARPRADLR